MGYVKQIAKILASSVVLLMVGSLVLVSRKHMLLAHKDASTMPSKQTFSVNVDNAYGTVLASKTNETMPRATVEHVAIKVPKNECCDKEVVRYGRLVYYPQSKATILICHGFMCDKFDVGFLRHMFPQGAFNFMTFDFRAHGEHCDGQRCTFGRDEAHDVIAAAHFLKNHPQLQGKPIIAYGFSMGAVAAIEAQAKDKTLFKAMILDCPFDSSENIIKSCLESLKFSILGYEFSIPACNILQKYAFHPYVQELIKSILKTVSTLDTKNVDMRMYPISPSRSASHITVPCFFIHCKNDEKVSVAAVKSVYENTASSYKKLWLTNGRRHFDSYFYNPEKYIKEIRAFIEDVVSRDLSTVHYTQVTEDPDELLTQI